MNLSSVKFPSLWDHQNKAYNLLKDGARNRHKRQMLMLPTGGGKTIQALHFIYGALQKEVPCAFICDRTALINQTSEVADRIGLPHGIIQRDHWRTDSSKLFQICSAQTMAKRKWPKFGLVVVDEAHCQHKSWVDYLLEFEGHAIGLSATPFAKGLGKIFTNLINAATMSDLVTSGVLVPMRVLSCVKPDMAGAAMTNGEWTAEAAAARGIEIIGDVVTEWSTHTPGQKTIMFGSTIKHCEEMCRQFNNAGILSAVYTSDTPEDERKLLLEEFRRRDTELRVLISCEALVKGVDIVDVEVIGDCRPLRKSLSTFIQMIGRGARASKETFKQKFTLLDFSGNVIRFKEKFEEIYFNGLSSLNECEKLDKTVHGSEEEVREPQKCPKCGAIPFFKRCVACGHEKLIVSTIEHHAGKMVEVMIGKKVAASNPANMWAQVCTYTRGHGAPETAHNRSIAIYKDLVGDFPPRSWRHETTPTVEISKPTLGMIRHRNIRYAKGKAKGAMAR